MTKTANKIAFIFFFTCENCGTKQAFKPNTVYEKGDCYVCGHSTKIPFWEKMFKKSNGIVLKTGDKTYPNALDARQYD